MLSETARDGRERGFNLCWSPERGRPFLEKECVGDSCRVSIPACEWPFQFASFHVHPSGGSWVPSPLDIRYSLAERELFSCVATPSRKRSSVRCYSFDLGYPDDMGRFVEAMRADDIQKQLDIIVKSIVSVKFPERRVERGLFRDIFDIRGGVDGS